MERWSSWLQAGLIPLLALGLVVVAAFVVGQPFLAEVLPVKRSPGVATVDPSTADRFMAALARGDAVDAAADTSPLYRLEWQGRGLSVDEVSTLVPSWFRPGGRGRWIDFTYLGGAIDESGFGHLLYLARPTGGNGIGAPSVWRVDLAPNGQVIWTEMVWIFSYPAAADPVDPRVALSESSYPPELAALSPRPLVGVRSEASPEAYYLASATVDGAPRLIFFARDEFGQFRPGVWSFTAPRLPSSVSKATIGSRPSVLLKKYLQDIG